MMVNEMRAKHGAVRENRKTIVALQSVNPDIGIVLTPGSAGAVCCNRTEECTSVDNH